MKPEQVRSLLMKAIRDVSDHKDNYCKNPAVDFSRNRKISMENVIKGIIGMEGKSLRNELVDVFDGMSEMPTASAFIQQRDKIKPEAFEHIYRMFTSKLSKKHTDELPVLAVDGTDIQIATNPDDPDSFFPGSNGQKPYNFIHLNCLYNLDCCTYEEAVIQKPKMENEHRALAEMVDRSAIPKAILTADRGYESYNSLAHIQKKGWFFLFRVKDGPCGIKQGLELPPDDSFDVQFSLNLCRKSNSETDGLGRKRNLYRRIHPKVDFDYLPKTSRPSDPFLSFRLDFRILRFKVSDEMYETIVTNLPADTFPPERIKDLYARRWGIETSFRSLKYTVGLLNLHARKIESIYQEVYARLIMYNFAEAITSHVVISEKERKHTYKADFSVAVHACRLFYRKKMKPVDLISIISKNIVPLRPDRHTKRRRTTKIFHNFFYRVA